jgi:hypothetical protein
MTYFATIKHHLLHSPLWPTPPIWAVRTSILCTIVTMYSCHDVQLGSSLLSKCSKNQIFPSQSLRLKVQKKLTDLLFFPQNLSNGYLKHLIVYNFVYFESTVLKNRSLLPQLTTGRGFLPFVNFIWISPFWELSPLPHNNLIRRRFRSLVLQDMHIFPYPHNNFKWRECVINFCQRRMRVFAPASRGPVRRRMHKMPPRVICPQIEISLTKYMCVHSARAPACVFSVSA